MADQVAGWVAVADFLESGVVGGACEGVAEKSGAHAVGVKEGVDAGAEVVRVVLVGEGAEVVGFAEEAAEGVKGAGGLAQGGGGSVVEDAVAG